MEEEIKEEVELNKDEYIRLASLDMAVGASRGEPHMASSIIVEKAVKFEDYIRNGAS